MTNKQVSIVLTNPKNIYLTIEYVLKYLIKPQCLTLFQYLCIPSNFIILMTTHLFTLQLIHKSSHHDDKVDLHCEERSEYDECAKSHEGQAIQCHCPKSDNRRSHPDQD